MGWSFELWHWFWGWFDVLWVLRQLSGKLEHTSFPDYLLCSANQPCFLLSILQRPSMAATLSQQGSHCRTKNSLSGESCYSSGLTREGVLFTTSPQKTPFSALSTASCSTAPPSS